MKLTAKQHQKIIDAYESAMSMQTNPNAKRKPEYQAYWEGQVEGLRKVIQIIEENN